VGVRDIDVLAIVATYGLDGPDGSRLAAGGVVRLSADREIVGAIVPSERHRTCASHPSISIGFRRTGGTELTGIDWGGREMHRDRAS